jgi:hypothetical protein
MDWNRLLSLLVAASYVVGSLVLNGLDGTVFVVFGYLIFCLGCIWYGEELGDFVGIGGKGIFISSPTPGRLIQIVGWLFLLLPVLAALIFGIDY